MEQNKLQIIIEALNKTEGEFRLLRQNLRETDTAVNKHSGSWRKLTADSESFRFKTGEISGMLKSLTGAFALYRGMSFLKSAIDEAETTQNALRGLGAVARYNGVEIGSAMQAASKLAADGLVDVTDASKALQNLLQRGFNLDEAVAMLERLKDSAAFNRQASLSMSEAVVSATEGLKNENSILVDNAGVTKNVSIMWKEYAGQIGKTVNDLTVAEKRQAEYNGIMKETEAQIGNAKLATEGLTGAKARLGVEIKNLKRALGSDLAPAFLEIAKAANWAIKNAIVPFIAGLEILSTKAAHIIDKIKLKHRESQLLFQKDQSAGDATKVKDLEAQLAAVRSRLAAGNKSLDEQIDDIMSKWSGELAPPQQGKDTGARRSDAAPGQKDAPDKAAANAQKEKERLDNLWIASEGAKLDEVEALNAKWFEDQKKAAADAQKEKERLDKELLDQEIEATKSTVQAEMDIRQAGIDGAAQSTRSFWALSAARHEAEIHAHLADLDLAEALGSAHRDTLTERISLLEDLRTAQEGALAHINKDLDPSGWYAQADAIRATTSALAGLAKEAAMTDPFAALRLALADVNKEWTDTGRQMYDVAKTTAESMEQAFGDFFFDAIHGKFNSLGDYLNSFLESVSRALTNVFAQMAAAGISSGVSSIFNSLSTPSAGSFDSNVGGWAANFSTAHHTGGMVGGYRIVPSPELLPHRHSGGLAPDERLVVNRVGERYITEEQNEWLTKIAASQQSRPADVYEPHVHLTVNALDSRSVSQALAQHESQIVGILQAAYNRRGKTGPWG